jgi:hypothetical protein
MRENTDKTRKARAVSRAFRARPWLFACLAALAWAFAPAPRAEADGAGQPPRVTANFGAGEALAPGARLELRASRPLPPGEGRLALFVADTDVTALCAADEQGLTYTPGVVPLPAGRSEVVVYLVTPADEWRELARLPLLVEEASAPAPGAEADGATDPTPRPAEAPADATTAAANADPFQFLPSVTVNIKAQSVALFFPESSRPDRINFTDLGLQATFRGDYTGGRLSLQNQFDLAGSSVRNEALRFGELGDRAPQVDLSSYLTQLRYGRLGLSVGHVSHGASRHLINNFSSRGLSVTVPAGKRLDLSAAVMNGTSVVGFGNFLGLSRREHRVASATVAGFNQSNVNDAERSRGASLRVLATDKSQRLRLDAGFTRSRFTNPADPLLYQGRDVVPVRDASRDAHYLDASFELLRGFALSERWKASLTAGFRHERVEPLFRSVAASAQADRLNNRLELSGGVGEITVAFARQRGDDNLANILSILKTETRQETLTVGIPSASLFGDPSKPSQWLPRLSYGFDRVSQTSPFVPVGGDFNSPAQIPDQAGTSQTFAAEWLLWEKLRLGYRLNHTFRDNRQLGREREDIQDLVNMLAVGFNPTRRTSLSFDLSSERASDFARDAVNRTARFGTSLTWNMTDRMVWAVSASTVGAGDRAATNSRRDADFDAQYSWNFLARDRGRWQKVQGQFFVRYSNRYARARDLLFGFNNLTKLQTFNAGLNFTFF